MTNINQSPATTPKTYYVEFSLCDGEERPYYLSDISNLHPNADKGFLKHTFSFFFEYSPAQNQAQGQYSLELLWDGITNSPLQSCIGVQPFGIRTGDVTYFIAGGPSPVLKIELEGDIDACDFLNQLTITCSPKNEYYFENWSGYKRILSEEELHQRGLIGEYPDSAALITITEGMRSTGETFVLETIVKCKISLLEDNNSEDLDNVEEIQGKDSLPEGWPQVQSLDHSHLIELDNSILKKLISDASITHKELTELATYKDEELAMLAPMHPLSDHEVIKSYWSIHDDGDKDTLWVEKYFEFNRSLPPNSPWRYCRWLVQSCDGYAQDILEQSNFEVDLEICMAIFELSKTTEEEYLKEMIQRILAQVANLPREIREQLDISRS